MGDCVNNGGGRPRANVDDRQVLELAKIGCTMAEIAAVVGTSVDTLERRFAETIRAGREMGRSSLRRAQWKLALSGNASMLMFLGKFYLGQKDELVFSSNEPDVRALLEHWEVSAKKKTSFDKPKNQKIVDIGA
jgi:hypothetical protein